VSWAADTNIASLVEDTSPQLGGFLDTNGNYIQNEQGTDIASATPTVPTDGDYFDVTGTTGITAFTVAADRLFTLQFDGIVTLTHAAALVLPADTNITTAAGDILIFKSTTANNVIMTGGIKADGTAWIGGSSGGFAWQATPKTAGFTAVADEGYFCNTTSTAFTVTLPASATAGDTISLVDYAGTFASNLLTIDPNGLNLNGSASSGLLSTAREAVKLVYADATQGWIASSSANEGDSSIGQIVDFEYLVVAGGGGGGSLVTTTPGGGGGGAGGMLAASGASLEAGAVYTATVGAGGAKDADGSDSSLIGSGVSLTAVGGGKGASYSGSTSPGIGGSGGGGRFNAVAGAAGTVGQGNDGGDGDSSGQGAAGGGGNTAAGTDATGGSPGFAGGTGTANSITGSAVNYAGGGGGGCGDATSGAGGTASEGGGAGGVCVDNGANGVAGTVNTGGGGGGGGGDTGGGAQATSDGGAGGSGIVILRVLTADYTGTITGSPTVTTDGSYTVIKFTGTGTYTA
jgi:hypothetical protein